MQHSNWMFLTRLIIVGRRTFYMRGLYITSVAYWHLGHFEAILNVMCHRKFMTFNHIHPLFFKSSLFSFQPCQKYKAFYHINFNFWFKSGTFLFPQSKLRKHMLPNHAVQNCPLCANARSVETGVKSSWNSSLACPSIHTSLSESSVTHFWVIKCLMNLRWECNMLVSSQLCLVHSFHLSVLVLLSLKILHQDFEIWILVEDFPRCIWFMQIKFYSSLIVKLIHPHSQYFLVIFIVVNTVSSHNASKKSTNRFEM